MLWEQIQQRDWLFGLPPQIADAIIARLEVADLKALRATCRQTYLQVRGWDKGLGDGGPSATAPLQSRAPMGT